MVSCGAFARDGAFGMLRFPVDPYAAAWLPVSFVIRWPCFSRVSSSPVSVPSFASVVFWEAVVWGNVNMHLPWEVGPDIGRRAYCVFTLRSRSGSISLSEGMLGSG